jgi:hypothetical protein
MPYLVQDMSERMWLLSASWVDEFIRMAEVNGAHQDALDELSISREEQESLGDALDGDTVWALNSSHEDYPVAWRFVEQPVLDALGLEEVNPAEMQALRLALAY